MRRIVAKGISYRLLALLCFGLGAVWTYWMFERSRETESQIAVHAIPTPETLEQKRRLSNGNVSKGWYGGHIKTCAHIFYVDDNPKLTDAARLRLKACQMESEEARRFVEKKWREKSPVFMNIQYPCVDCRIVYDVWIEQGNEQKWQITIWRRPDEKDTKTSEELVAVEVRRRPANGYDFEEHVIGESVLAFVDASGKEILSL